MDNTVQQPEFLMTSAGTFTREAVEDLVRERRELIDALRDAAGSLRLAERDFRGTNLDSYPVLLARRRLDAAWESAQLTIAKFTTGAA